jgi:hypothetical protein
MYSTKLILLVVFAIISQYLYRSYKLSEELFDTYEHYQLVSDYFIGEQMSRRKPILWIHTSTELNARNWESFYSRSNKKLNQPYLQITMKSIYDKCKDSFNVCLFDDDVFRRLLSWNIDLEDLAEPMKSHYRKLGISLLLQTYGGMVVPQSLLCVKNLIDMYNTGLFTNNMFVVENTTRNSHLSEPYFPDTRIMSCKKGSMCMKEFAEFQEELYKDKTSQSDLEGNTRLWLNKRTDVTIIDGKFVGLKKIDGKPVLLEELLGTTHIELPETTYGIDLPEDEILSRSKYSWFARMSTDQILKSSLLIAKYTLASY